MASCKISGLVQPLSDATRNVLPVLDVIVNVSNIPRPGFAISTCPVSYSWFMRSWTEFGCMFVSRHNLLMEFWSRDMQLFC